MIATLKSIVSCVGSGRKFQGTCFDHAFFEVCKYATTDEKVCKGLRYVFVKAIANNSYLPKEICRSV
jgi:hypothetical protein